jgi:enoyl-CoA hydratase/carnithine racemase
MTADPQGLPVFETIQYETGADGVATITLNRPDRMNAFNDAMIEDFRTVWRLVREDSDVRAVVLRANGDRAFSAGLDVVEGRTRPPSVWDVTDPGQDLAPKANEVWTPVVTAVHGMCAGGALYWVNESDIVICSDDAMFFDPHVTYGMTAAYEPIHMSGIMPFPEIMRLSLLGNHERMSAQRAHEIGMVSELAPAGELMERATWAAEAIASAPPLAIQGTVRAVWGAREHGQRDAVRLGYAYVAMGTSQDSIAEGQKFFESGKRIEWRLR